MADHRIDITLADSSRIRYRVIYLGDHIGTWSDPESAAARYMLIRGIAGKEDTLIAYRNGKASLTGGVGWLAKSGAGWEAVQAGRQRVRGDKVGVWWHHPT